jgi:hypothetical protein
VPGYIVRIDPSGRRITVYMSVGNPVVTSIPAPPELVSTYRNRDAKPWCLARTNPAADNRDADTATGRSTFAVRLVGQLSKR